MTIFSANGIGEFFLLAALCIPAIAVGSDTSQSSNAAGNQIGANVLRIDESRPCGAPTKRQYAVRHQGIGFEILDSESEACFVPDQEYRLLDDLIDSVLARTVYDGTIRTTEAQRQQAATISKTISDVLDEHQFELFIDTETLSDALIERVDSTGNKRHIFDCDTGSLIFLTIAEALGAPVSMVEMPLPGNNDHNYVRWLANGLKVWKIFTDEPRFIATRNMFCYLVDPVAYIQALEACLTTSVDVLNLSVAGPVKPEAEEEEPIKQLIANGTTVVAAMGNERMFGSSDKLSGSNQGRDRSWSYEPQ